MRHKMPRVAIRFFSCLLATGYITAYAAAQSGYLAALVVLCSGIGVAIWSLHWS